MKLPGLMTWGKYSTSVSLLQILVKVSYMAFIVSHEPSIVLTKFLIYSHSYYNNWLGKILGMRTKFEF